jgi:dipeptidyl aminopeptidase/acylaminoacyl peptidase
MLLVLVLMVLIPTSGWAQLTAEQALSIRQIQEPRFSPDGNRIAFTVVEAPKGNGNDRNVWVADIKSGDVIQFTKSPKSDSSPRWSPDGKKLAFLSDRDGMTQIYLFSMIGGEPAVLTEGKNGIQSFEWSPDGSQIAFLAAEPKTDDDDKKEKDRDDAHVADRDERQARLWVVDVATKKVRRITPAPWQISEVRWLLDGKGLILSATDHPEADQNTHRIFSLNLESDTLKEIASPKGPFGRLSISPDGKLLAYVGSRVDGPSPHDLYTLPIAGGVPKNLTAASIDRPVGQYEWQKDSSILATFQFGFQNKLYRISPDGKPAPLAGFDVNPAAFDVAGDGSLAFSGETAAQMPELWLSDRQGVARRLTHFNDSWKTIRLGQPEILKYKSFDGAMIEAMLLTPPDYTAGTKLPFVVLVHGGPTGRWSDTFEAWGQLLATRGYAVLYPNIRGSVGYGHNFIEANRADWGGGDFKDVMAGVEAMIERGIADPQRLGIGGWSYGGYMTAWAITQTNRFKAAVSGAPVIDMASEFGTERGSSYDEWFYGLPYEKLDGFIKSSPMTYVKNARTPTLLLQGEADTTDPIGQSQQFYRGLKRYGVKSDLVLYPREGHGLREEKHLLDRLHRIVDWFDSNMK